MICQRCGEPMTLPDSSGYHPLCDPVMRAETGDSAPVRKRCRDCPSVPLGLTPNGRCGWCEQKAEHRRAAQRARKARAST